MQTAPTTKGIYHPPYYSRGDTKIYEWLKAHMIYPDYARKNNLRGDVVVNILISKTGRLVRSEVVHSAHPVLDAAAVEMCNKLPFDFSPATLDGKPVDAYFRVCIQFGARYGANTSAQNNENNASVNPSFPGGKEALMKQINANIIYPPLCREQRIEGTVDVKIMVKKDGQVGEVMVVKSVHKLLDEEAQRVCKLLPKFYAGSINGKDTGMWYPLSIKFTVPEGEYAAKSSASSTSAGAGKTTRLPQFPGGLTEFNRFLEEHMKYPIVAQEQEIQGTVVVEVTVKADGSVEDAEVVQSVHRWLDKEALRICQLLPTFEPGLKDGVPTECRMKIPIKFSME